MWGTVRIEDGHDVPPAATHFAELEPDERAWAAEGGATGSDEGELGRAGDLVT